MASRTQIRLSQITGSLANREGGISNEHAASGATSMAEYNVVSGSLVGLMSDVVSSITRIHGADIFASNANSTLKDIAGTDRITYVNGAKTLIVGEGTGTDSIDINAAGGFDLDAAGVFTANAVGTSNLTTNGALTISGSTGLNLLSDGGTLDIETRVGAIDIDSAGALTIDSATSIGIGTAADVAFDINTAALDIDSSGAITIDGTSTFSIDGVGASNVTTKGALTVSGSSGLNLHSDSGVIDIDSRQGAITIDSNAAGVSIDAGAASNFSTSAGALTLAGASLDVDATGGAFNIAATAASEIITTGGTLTVDGKTGVVIQENNQTIISIDDDRDVDYSTAVRNYVLTGSGTANIDAGGAINIGTSASTNTISIGTAGVRAINIGSANADVTITSDNNTTSFVGAVSMGGALTVSGDFTVLGAATEISSSNTVIKDALIVLNSSSIGDGTPIAQDAGIIFAQPDVSRALFVDQSDSNIMKFTKTYSSGTATAVDIGLGLADVALKKLYFHDGGGEHITGDGTDLTIASSAKLNLTATSDVHIPKNVGLVFDDNASEKIESNDTDLTITSGAKIKLTATTDVEIPDNIGLLFGSTQRGIESDGNNLNVLATSGFLGINFGNNEGIVYKENNVQFGKLTNEASNALTLSSSLGPITLSSNTGVFNLHQFGNLGGTITSDIMGNSELIISGAQGNALKLAAGADSIKLAVEENELFTVKSASGLSVLSSSAGRQLVLESNTDKIRFSEASGNLKIDFDLNVNASTAAIDIDEFRMLQLDGGSTKHFTISGSQTELKGGAAAHKLQFFDAGESHYVELKAPAITDNVELILPAADATVTGQALVSNASGQLSFATVGASGTRKGVFVVDANGFDPGANFDIDSADQGDNITLGGVDGDQGRVVDVFVNGQLMTSGSEAQRTASPPTVDFEIKSTTRLLFAFGLELDDIVTVVKRG